MKKIIVSGIQPTGNLHIGNYLGAVKNWVELQNSGKYQMYIFIADYHSLTGNMTANERREQITRTSAELLACGIDPEKTVFWVQSHVQEHTELAWIFNCATPLGELDRMTQFKDKAGLNRLSSVDKNKFYELVEKGRYEEAVNLQQKEMIDNSKKIQGVITGLLTYPVLQAADILLYHGELVPVGQDQVQHVELTRDIARWFNNRYENYFPETKALLTEIPKVMSLLEPTKKMSKSLGQDHVIELADEPAVIEKKLKKAVTASEGGGEAPGVENLLLLLKEFGNKELYSDFASAEKDKTIRYGELKQTLAKVIGEYFVDFRKRRAELLEQKDELADILSRGAEKARTVAIGTMEEVRKMVGIRSL